MRPLKQIIIGIALSLWASISFGQSAGFFRNTPADASDVSVAWSFSWNPDTQIVTVSIIRQGGFAPDWYGGQFVWGLEGYAAIGNNSWELNVPLGSPPYPATSTRTASFPAASGAVINYSWNGRHAGLGTNLNLGGGTYIVGAPEDERSFIMKQNLARFFTLGGEVQVATGGEDYRNSLISVKGARDVAFVLHYSGLLAAKQLNRGDVGFGWAHNFESQVVAAGTTIQVYKDGLQYFTFLPVSGQAGTYASPDDGARNEVLSALPVGGWKLLRPDQSSLTYDASGRLIEDRDRNGRLIQVSYSATSAKLQRVQDAASGAGLNFAYDASGTISSISDDAGRTVSVAYLSGAVRTISSFTNQNGKSTSILYDIVNARPRATTMYDHNSVAIAINDYDGDGRVWRQRTPQAWHSFARTYTSDRINATFVDGHGKTSSYAFDLNYNLLTYVDTMGRTTSYTYDAANRMTSVTDPLGRARQFTYDTQGNVLTETDAAGKVTTHTYDSRNNRLSTTLPNGQASSWTYDAANNVLTATDALGQTTTWTYNADSLPTSMTMPRGGTFTYAYTSGRLTQTTSPTGVIERFGYDGTGRVLYREDGLGKRVSFTYDAVGNVLTATNALGQVTQYTYDHRNRMLSTTDAAGATTSYTYNHAHWVTSKTDALGRSTTYHYTADGWLTAVVDPLGYDLRMTYDDVGRLLTSADKSGRITKYEYDAAGQRTAVEDPAGRRTLFGYDSRGLSSSVTDPLGRVQAFSYDNSGRLTQSTDALGRTTTLGYDAANRLVQVQDPMGQLAQQGFDADGNLTSFVDPAARLLAMTYDLGGRSTGLVTPAGRTSSKTYDARGLVSTSTEASGQVTTFGYDDAARPSSMTDSVGAISIARDAVGRPVTVTENGKTISRTYNALGQVVSYTDALGNVIGYEYDTLNRLRKLTYPDGKQVTYTYNRAGQLVSVNDWVGRTTSYVYDTAGRMTQILRPNGWNQVRTYDAAGQIVQQTEVSGVGAPSIFSTTFAYDLVGRVQSEVVAPEQAVYEAPATQTFDNDNRLLTHNGGATTFDDDGNLLTATIEGTASAYTYDARNRLVGAGGLTYGYDAEDRRVSVTDGTGVTTYAINPEAVLDQVLVRTAPNGTKTYYLYGIGLLGEETGGQMKYYHYNRRGDTVALTNMSGAVTDRMAYGAFGRLSNRQGTTATPFLSGGLYGLQQDANGLSYMRSRYYHPTLRRFLNQDTVLGTIAAPNSLNRFAFVDGNPISKIDPFGTFPINLAPNSVSFAAAAFIPGSSGKPIAGQKGTWVDEPGTWRGDVATDNRESGSFYTKGSTSRLSTTGTIPVGLIGKLGAFSQGGNLAHALKIQSVSSESHLHTSSGVRTATGSASQVVSAIDTGPNSSTIIVSASAGYPLLPSMITPNIDYTLRIDVSRNPETGAVTLGGQFEANRYPAYEVYVNRSQVLYLPPIGAGPGPINLNTSRTSVLP